MCLSDSPDWVNFNLITSTLAKHQRKADAKLTSLAKSTKTYGT